MARVETGYFSQRDPGCLPDERHQWTRESRNIFECALCGAYMIHVDEGEAATVSISVIDHDKGQRAQVWPNWTAKGGR